VGQSPRIANRASGEKGSKSSAGQGEDSVFAPGCSGKFNRLAAESDGVLQTFVSANLRRHGRRCPCALASAVKQRTGLAAPESPDHSPDHSLAGHAGPSAMEGTP
tara:strand:- start:3011 stop:3325 length:315 start_codon:yes stop_codon:yes gene_type:complete